MNYEKINALIEKEVARENKKLIGRVSDLEKKLSEVRKSKNELSKKLGKLEDKENEFINFSNFKHVFDERTFEFVLESNFKPTISLSNYDKGDSLKYDLYYVLKYYNNREEVFNLMKLFGIKTNLSTHFTLPRDYPKEAIKSFFKCPNYCKWNGCYTSGNYKYAFDRSFHIKRGENPLQEYFMSPFCLNDDIYDLIIKNLENDKIFFRFFSYHEVSDKQFSKAVEVLIKKYKIAFNMNRNNGTIYTFINSNLERICAYPEALEYLFPYISQFSNFKNVLPFEYLVKYLRKNDKLNFDHAYSNFEGKRQAKLVKLIVEEQGNDEFGI